MEHTDVKVRISHYVGFLQIRSQYKIYADPSSESSHKYSHACYLTLINVMPHNPPLRLCRGKGGAFDLPSFDTKTCPICGEFDYSPYVRATIKSTDGQISHLFLDF